MEITNYKGNTAFKASCDHCGNTTFQGIKVSEVVQENTKLFTYTLSRCTICDGVTLRKHTGDWNAPRRLGVQAESDESESTEQLWPPGLSLSHEAPLRVRQIYEEARATKRNSPSSFVVQIGRALEAVAKNKQAQGQNLSQKIDWLISQQLLPKLFGEMGHINRILRNWGAHDADVDIEPGDAEIVDEFFKAIIEYLYVAPAKVQRVNTLLAQRKTSP